MMRLVCVVSLLVGFRQLLSSHQRCAWARIGHRKTQASLVLCPHWTLGRCWSDGTLPGQPEASALPLPASCGLDHAVTGSPQGTSNDALEMHEDCSSKPLLYGRKRSSQVTLQVLQAVPAECSVHEVSRTARMLAKFGNLLTPTNCDALQVDVNK